MENTQTVTWQTKDGREVVVAVKAEKEITTIRTIWADGHEVVDDTPRLVEGYVIDATVAGVKVGEGAPVKTSQAGIYRIGQLGVTEENRNRILAAVEAAMDACTTQEIAEFAASRAAAEAKVEQTRDDHDAHLARMARIMGE